MPPPLSDALLALTLQLMSVRSPPKFKMPPPCQEEARFCVTFCNSSGASAEAGRKGALQRGDGRRVSKVEKASRSPPAHPKKASGQLRE